MKNFYSLILILLVTTGMYSQQQIGKHTLEEWRYIIDTTWGPGLSTGAKEQLFDNFWNAIDQKHAGFHNIEDRWLELKSYRDTVSLGVSKGRFAGIMGTLVKSLQDGHVYMSDNQITETPLQPGIPLLFTAAVTYPSYSWDFASHFGAALTPLPDSTLLVYAAVPNHPIGLLPGDLVLGYDGELWKDLYKKLFEVQFPVPGFLVMSGSERACTYQLLQSAGMNWHLFDTIDVVKYNTSDTLHFSTDMLSNSMPGIHVNEQLSVPGVPFPNQTTGRQVSWGIISGTKIGYIYVWGWTLSSAPFLAAVNALMPDSITDGLIIDMRMNEGGYMVNWIPGLRKLFNENVENMRWLRRSSPSNHLAMQDAGSFFLTGSNRELYDRPIAILCGPWAISGGDMTVHYLREHPMVRTFGLPTNGSFGEVSLNNISGIPSTWTTGYVPWVCYTPPDMNNILNHTSVPVDEEIWLTQDGVAAGEDDVVKRAVEWINNLVFGHDLLINNTYCKPAIDTLKISALIENPNSHQVSSKVYIKNLQGNFADSLELNKTGLSGNSEIWTGNYLVPVEEDIFRISLSATDIAESKTWVTKNISRFTTVGPVVFDSIDYVYNSASKEYRIKLSVHNLSITDTITQASVKLFCNDSWIISVTPEVRALPDIFPGSTAQTSSYFAVKIDTAIFPGYFNFQLEVLSDGWIFWQDSTKAVVTGIDDEQILPLSFRLEQNYPNPFNPTTSIEYRVGSTEIVTLKVYDILGNEITTLVNEEKPAGTYEIKFDAGNLSSGVYFYQLKAGDFIATKKLLLLK